MTLPTDETRTDMRLMARLLHWTSLPAGRRVMAVLGTMLVIVLACNPDLLPLLPVVDALGLDVLALLLGAQVMAMLPWLRESTGRWMRLAVRIAAGLAAGTVGGYLRQLAMHALIRSGTNYAIYRA